MGFIRRFDVMGTAAFFGINDIQRRALDLNVLKMKVRFTRYFNLILIACNTIVSGLQF
jgi:hypothetical protein